MHKTNTAPKELDPICPICKGAAAVIVGRNCDVCNSTGYALKFQAANKSNEKNLKAYYAALREATEW